MTQNSDTPEEKKPPLEAAFSKKKQPTSSVRKESELGSSPDLIHAVSDIPVQVSAVLGHITMPIANLLKLGRGAVIQLEKRVGETVDLFVNDRLVARGEVIVLEEHLGITITEIMRTDYV